MDQTKDCTRELIAKAHNNDKEAREKLVTDNLGLIWNIIKRFKGRGTEQEDLFQIGCIGLIKAIDNFNLDIDEQILFFNDTSFLGNKNQAKYRTRQRSE